MDEKKQKKDTIRRVVRVKKELKRLRSAIAVGELNCRIHPKTAKVLRSCYNGLNNALTGGGE